MDAFLAELRACLADLGPDPDIADTFITDGAPQCRAGGAEPDAAPAAPAGASVVLLLLAALAAAGVAAVLLLDNGSPGGSGSTSRDTTTPSPWRRPSCGRSASYDPPSDGGDGHEHDGDVPKATDGDPATAWTTETYRSFTKPGVGIVLDAGRAASPRQVVVLTDTPGYTAEIQAGDSATGPFHAVSSSQTVDGRATFAIKDGTSNALLRRVDHAASTGRARPRQRGDRPA